MTTFDELIGAEPAGAERQRLRSVHDLLVEAGPPPELTPQLESGPTLAMTLGRVQRMRKSRRMLIPAIAAALIIAVIVGGITSRGGDGSITIPLAGTARAQGAAGSLHVLPPTKTTQPMQIAVQGLEPGQYAVYLVHNGRSWEKCGTFVVKNLAGGRATTINSPYRAKKGDLWVVTRLTATGHGVTVMRPATT